MNRDPESIPAFHSLTLAATILILVAASVSEWSSGI